MGVYIGKTFILINDCFSSLVISSDEPMNQFLCVSLCLKYDRIFQLSSKLISNINNAQALYT